jgi:hypothetical protein
MSEVYVSNETYISSEICLKVVFYFFLSFFSVLRIWDPVLFRSGSEIRDGKKSGSDIRHKHLASDFRELSTL